MPLCLTYGDDKSIQNVGNAACIYTVHCPARAYTLAMGRRERLKSSVVLLLFYYETTYFKDSELVDMGTSEGSPPLHEIR